MIGLAHLVHIKQEGAPAHPEDVYTHCGCAKCNKRWAKQALAYYSHLKKQGLLSPSDERDPWFPQELL